MWNKLARICSNIKFIEKLFLDPKYYVDTVKSRISRGIILIKSVEIFSSEATLLFEMSVCP